MGNVLEPGFEPWSATAPYVDSLTTWFSVLNFEMKILKNDSFFVLMVKNGKTKRKNYLFEFFLFRVTGSEIMGKQKWMKTFFFRFRNQIRRLIYGDAVLPHTGWPTVGYCLFPLGIVVEGMFLLWRDFVKTYFPLLRQHISHIRVGYRLCIYFLLGCFKWNHLYWHYMRALGCFTKHFNSFNIVKTIILPLPEVLPWILSIEGGINTVVRYAHFNNFIIKIKNFIWKEACCTNTLVRIPCLLKEDYR